MAITERLSASQLLDGFRAVSSVLAEHAPALDRLDAGDGDLLDDGTDPGAPADGAVADAAGEWRAGSDLMVTLRSAVAAAEGSADMAQLWDAIRSGAAEEAKGRAGRDLAGLLDGMAEVMRNADHLDAERLALSLELGAERIAPGDDGAHPGSFAAVASAAAAGALGAVDSGADLADTLIGAADEGLAELEEGPRSNPLLVERGLVDAGAAGFLLVLDTLTSVITGEPTPAPPPEVPRPAVGSARFLVSCRVEPREGCGLESANWMESLWHELGDLVHFDGTSSTWSAAVVTSLPGPAIEAVFEVGRPRELDISLAADPE